MKKLIIAIIALVFIYSCKDSNITGPEINGNGYNMLLSGETGNIKVELYDSAVTRFGTGYNNIGIKVFVDNIEKTEGYVKMHIYMYHTFINSYHATPVSPVFNYNADKKMFTGYTSLLMHTDTTSYCMAFINYNDEKFVDSLKFDVYLDTTNQIRGFIDFTGGHSYIFSIISPKYPAVGMNDLKFLFHRTGNDIDYDEVDSAQMFIRTLNEETGNSSTGNINPVSFGNGLYSGNVNLNEEGIWFVYDSVKYQNRIITNNPPPKFIFRTQ